MSRKKNSKSIYPIDSINGDDDVLYDVLIASEEKTSDPNKKNFVNELIKFLKQNNYTFKKMKLPVFDYIINRGKGVLIEMKTLEDFISSFTGENEKHDQKSRIISQSDRMIDENYFPNSMRKMLIINDSLNKKMIEETTYKENNQVHTTRHFKYSPTSEEYSQIEGKKEKTNSYSWKDATIGKKKGKYVNRIHVNRWLSFLSVAQSYVQVIELGGIYHTVDYFRLLLDKAKKDEKLKGDDIILHKIEFNKSLSEDTPDYKKMHIILQNFALKLGNVRVHKLLSKYKTLENFFDKVKHKNDFIICSTKNDGTLDKVTDEVADEYFRILKKEYDLEDEIND